MGGETAPGATGGALLPVSLDCHGWNKALLSLCLWREARGEPREGIEAVASVIRNRVWANSAEFGHGWVRVLTKKWQFSSLSAPGDPQLILYPACPDPRFTQCMEIAEACYGSNGKDGSLPDNTQGSLWYANLDHVPSYSSFWRIVQDKVKVGKIGAHTFYRNP